MSVTIKRIRSADMNREIGQFIIEVGTRLKYSEHFPGWKKFKIGYFCDHHLVGIAYKAAKPVGIVFGVLSTSAFDPEIKILNQGLLWTETYGVAPKLLDYYIDFGKSHADHIITAVGSETRIKGESLEKRGFKKLETTYRMKV